MAHRLLYFILLFPVGAFSNPSDKYAPENIQKLISTTDHGFFDYLRRLGIPEKEVLEAKGKRWLSVGEGRSNFVSEAARRGVDSQALDAVVKNPFAPERSTIGLSQHLPFPDQSFDRVISVWLVDYFFDPKAFNDPESGKQSLLEMIRVTKMGGDIRINPIQQGGVLSALDHLQSEGRIKYETLPYFKGHFTNNGKFRVFEIDPVQQTTGSVRITRLK